MACRWKFTGAGGNAWRKVEGVMGDRHTSRKLKGKVLSLCITSAYLRRRNQENKRKSCVYKRGRRIAGVKRVDKGRMEELREEVGVSEELREEVGVSEELREEVGVSEELREEVGVSEELREEVGVSEELREEVGVIEFQKEVGKESVKVGWTRGKN